ncbi:pilus assembly protein TadG-related protein [Phenylobacterium montanum]|uniref:Putative Flp pilus-assembly TadG-like N-terminal domain-containing protein n=1 Tax=Phenylobacterium montanum TaxID=2823693 RepID=A0A975G0L9_9CAUL|nr:pilus assembly protein TadG-related protein [Caulobacter sp. S6]QUD88594.1 hypothetical protein KCG34_01495 [Caulobacter sp. S6]
MIALLRNRRGSVSPLLALMLIPLIGAMSIGAEASSWFLIKRAAQTAADAAVLAAASNGCDPSAACYTDYKTPSFSDEAKAVAARYNFPNGSYNTTVTAADNQTCPSPSTATNCYQVTITKLVPISLVNIVGYKGNGGSISGAPAEKIVVTAMASYATPLDPCMLATANTQPAHGNNSSFQLNGSANFDAGGCVLYSNGSATCNGHNGGFGDTITVSTTDKNCGTKQITGAGTFTDPFTSQLKNNPLKNCTAISSPSADGTTLNWSTAQCVTITGNFTIPAGSAGTKATTNTPGTVLVINNGNLVLNGNFTVANSGLTIVFTGTAGGAPGFITGNGTIDYGAPSSGAWSGFAIYQDPAMTSPTNQVYSGNSPTFDITGLVYAPYTNLTFQGAINHETKSSVIAGGGYACLSVVASNFTTSGTGSIFANPTSQCDRAGVSGLIPSPDSVLVRQALVQ